MFRRLHARQEFQFARAIWAADRPLAACWWAIVVLRSVLPAGMAVAMGYLVGAVQGGDSLVAPLAVFGGMFIGLQMLTPLHVAASSNLGDRTAAYLYDQLTAACIEPPGIAHLENPDLTADLTVARDFDLGMTGPPLFISMDFIASGLIQLLAGLVAAIFLFGFSWWAPILLAGAWLSTHWLLRESSVWNDRNTDTVRAAQRDSEYAYRLAVDPPAAKELRLFGLEDWTLNRFIERRRVLHRLQYEATRLREKSVIWSVLIVSGASIAVFWALADAAADGALSLGQTVAYAQLAVGTSTIAFGGLNWALDGAAAPVAAALRLQRRMAPEGALPIGAGDAEGLPSRSLHFRDVSFTYPGGSAPVLQGFNLDIPAGTSLAIVGQNGAGKTTLAKLICRLYDPTEGAIAADGADIRTLEIGSWRSRIAAVFQDYVRYERTLRQNVDPAGIATDAAVRAALDAAGAGQLASLDTVLSRAYEGGTDLSGGQWQRVAIARALCRIQSGAGIVLLDEPTAQLDVRGEAEIFERVLAATRGTTTLLVSHRFSTVRHADRICVVEHGRVIELGTHDELMALGGRYRTMFDLQAQRFADDPEEEGVTYDVLT
jgi:ATP-binding cassette subfamily B protein